ncbi:UbiA prenyltransferase family-domain-containing protein [Irpex rosettiformis]|uniref:UbiA prenyltransferase family-domain-containing protein n=1 Tax=Irpex rosettiformis TaxID=378272 RepID=A0ACB8TXU8_9APHY|nr:UbiA prenyltransferase family-domain-containing protein [Irpex rosettiformis]
MISPIDLQYMPSSLTAISLAGPHLRLNIPGISNLFRFIARHIHTAILFTWTDYKTIFLPITVFGCATAPVQSIGHLLQACLWIWLHLLLCNVSNQASSKSEDLVNRPWRPLPAGRVNDSQIKILRVTMIGLCISWSLALYGVEIMLVTLGLVLTTYAYDEMGLARSPVGKNFCNIWGYVSFETAAVRLMGSELSFDHVARVAVCLSGTLIFSTIQAQDFPDVEGDKAAGRVTLPIYAPELSRVFTLLIIPLWSAGLSWYWGVGWVTKVATVLLGCLVGVRYYAWRTPKSDRRSYLIFNVWLGAMSILPLHARFGVFAF